MSLLNLFGKSIGPIGALWQVAEATPKVFNPNDNILTALGNLGITTANQFTGGKDRQYFGKSALTDNLNKRVDTYNDSIRPIGTPSTLNGSKVRWGGKSWIPEGKVGGLSKADNQINQYPVGASRKPVFDPSQPTANDEIGRASCRERV